MSLAHANSQEVLMDKIRIDTSSLGKKYDRAGKKRAGLAKQYDEPCHEGLRKRTIRLVGVIGTPVFHSILVDARYGRGCVAARAECRVTIFELIGLQREVWILSG